MCLLDSLPINTTTAVIRRQTGIVSSSIRDSEIGCTLSKSFCATASFIPECVRVKINDIVMRSHIIIKSLQYLPSLLFGLLFGVSVTILFVYQQCFQIERKFSPRLAIETTTYDSSRDADTLHAMYESELHLSDIKSVLVDDLDLDENRSDALQVPTNYVNKTVANQLKKSTRILCWILSQPNNHETRARHIKKTWGKHCNKFLVMSSKRDDKISAIGLNVTEQRDYLWQKTKEAFKYVYTHHLNDADWFFKGDDDTYANIENMRYFLQSYSTDDPIYFGYKFKVIVQPQGYFSGGAGYVLSKKALIKFIEEALPNPKLCKQEDTGAEDAEIGVCMQNVHVYAGDTRDSLGRGRFFIHSPVDHLRQNNVDKTYWYWRNQFYKTDEGLDCCSDRAISWHYVTPEQFYYLDSFLFKLRVYGRVVYPEELPKKVNFTEVVKALELEVPE